MIDQSKPPPGWRYSDGDRSGARGWLRGGWVNLSDSEPREAALPRIWEITLRELEPLVSELLEERYASEIAALRHRCEIAERSVSSMRRMVRAVLAKLSAHVKGHRHAAALAAKRVLP